MHPQSGTYRKMCGAKVCFLLKWKKNEKFLHKNLYMLENFYTFAGDYQRIVVRVREHNILLLTNQSL